MKKIILFFLTAFTLTSFGQNGLNFDGVDDYVQTTFPGIDGDADRTMEAWINLDALAASTVCIMDFGSNVAGGRNTLIVNASRSIRYLVGGGTVLSPDDAITAGEWTHVALVIEGDNGYIYVNGIEVASTIITAVDTELGTDLRIGDRVPGGSIPFYGSIDEVRVWDVALTAEQIIENMNVEICSGEGLVANFHLNEGDAGRDNTGITNTAEQIEGNDGELLNFDLIAETSNWVTGVELEVLPSYAETNTFTECAGFSITVGENTYTESGVYTDVLPTVLGCDSIIVTDLTIVPYGMNELIISECIGFSIELNGTTYDGTGFYSDTLVGEAANGCDSIINLDLTIFEPVINNIEITECQGYSIMVNGTRYAETGFYTETVEGASPGGCDSIINLDLTILSAGINNLTLSECLGYSIEINGNEYDETGFYTELLTGEAANGCDSIINLFLTITGLVDATTTTEFGPIITANNSDASYQWIDCATMSEIDGATEQSFEVTENGEYAVIVTEAGCSETSECVDIANVGIEYVNATDIFNVYPNPANEKVTIQTTDLNNASVTILDLTGKTIVQSNFVNNVILDIDFLPAGVYVISVTQENNNQNQLLIKQ